MTTSIAAGFWARRALIASSEDAVRAGRVTLRALGIICVVGALLGIGVWVDRNGGAVYAVLGVAGVMVFAGALNALIAAFWVPGASASKSSDAAAVMRKRMLVLSVGLLIGGAALFGLSMAFVMVVFG